jgi:hypothetical protein
VESCRRSVASLSRHVRIMTSDRTISAAKLPYLHLRELAQRDRRFRLKKADPY